MSFVSGFFSFQLFLSVLVNACKKEQPSSEALILISFTESKFEIEFR